MIEDKNDIVEELQIEYEDLNGGTIMEKPFDPTLIKIETKTPSLDTLIKRIRGKSVHRITSYNVCYTKLLRLIADSIVRLQSLEDC